MRAPVLTIEARAPLHEIAEMLKSHDIKRLPVKRGIAWSELSAVLTWCVRWRPRYRSGRWGNPEPINGAILRALGLGANGRYPRAPDRVRIRGVLDCRNIPVPRSVRTRHSLTSFAS